MKLKITHVPFEEVAATDDVAGPPDFHYFQVNGRRYVYSSHSKSVSETVEPGCRTTSFTYDREVLSEEQVKSIQAIVRLIS